MPTVLDAADAATVLPAARQELCLWALVMALAVLSYGTHVAAIRGAGLLPEEIGGVVSSSVAGSAAAAPVQRTSATALPGRRSEIAASDTAHRNNSGVPAR